MTEFVGRTGSLRVYSYPETPRAVNPLIAFARNFATGPKSSVPIGVDGVVVPWNAIDALSTTFTVVAGGVTVSIAGDVTASFTNGDTVDVIPSVPGVLPPVQRTIVSVPVFASGFTTFDLNSNIDPGTTTGGTIGNSINVPITPRATGVVRISGVITVSNGDVAQFIQLTIRVNGINMLVPANLLSTCAASGQVAIPFLAETTPTDTPIGTTSNISIFVAGDNGSTAVLAEASAIDVQEVSVATG